MIRRLGLVLAGVCLAVGSYWLRGKAEAKLPIPHLHSTRSQLTSSKRFNPGTRAVANATRLPPGQLSAADQPFKPPPRKRPWDPAFLASLERSAPGDSIRFELVPGEFAAGQIRHLLRTKNELTYVSGVLTLPQTGRFFFQKQTLPGVAGDYVGVITFPDRDQAYRIEPIGPAHSPELVERPLGDVLCRRFPLAVGIPPNQAAQVPPLKPGNLSRLPIPNYQNGIVVLQSLRGATPVIYLDFQGGYTPTWGGVAYDRPNVNNDQIFDVWERVSEDFRPFNINVTTDQTVYQSAPENSRQRVIITPTTTLAPEFGGIAMVGSFNWTGDTPCWVFTTSGKACAEACSHEAGHTLGLTHEGQEYGGLLYEYYTGHGIGEESWAPIMGLPYYANVTQWSKGEYLDPDNLQDELAIITTQNNNVTFRPDDTGNTLATSRYVDLYSDYTASAQGIIERAADTDAFRFTTRGGDVSLRADPVEASPNLAIQVALYDENDVLLASNNPQDTLWASLTTNLPAGTYTFQVTGAGRNDPLTNGFSSYDSLGYYSITGSVANAALPTRFSVIEHATNGTVVGIIQAISTNNPLLFRISSGNTANTFALDSSGTLSVADNSLLDYDSLAGMSQFAIQFELFVDITDQTDPALTETNRRVVVAVLYIPTPPFIGQQPGDIMAPAGSSPSFVVSAAGDLPLAYQWFFDDKPVLGAVTSGLSFTNVQSRDAGAYAVVITNALGAITSLVAHLSVTPSLPVISLQPVAQGTALGFPASFRVAASGTEPLAYQWQFNGTNIDGATNASLLLPNLLREFTGLYRAVISNQVGITTSAEASLSLVPVAAWGWNASGQTNLYSDLTNAVQISAGPAYNLALRRDGTVFVWGATNQIRVPPDFTNIVAVAAGGDHTLALRNDGSVMAWGVNSSGQGPVLGLSQVLAIAAGGGHSLALKSDGKVVGWGLNSDGQATVPPQLTNAVAIAAGSNHSLALDGNGNVWAWGANALGQAKAPAGLSNLVSIAAGAAHTLALTSDGTVVAWGSDAYGQSSVPGGVSNIIAVAAGAYHSLALNRVGTIFAWGAGWTNALYYPQFGQAIIPQPIRNGNVTAIAGGSAHTLAFDGDTAPFITQSPVGCTAYTGHRVFFRVAATGARPLSYRWQLNGTSVPGTAEPLLVIPYALTNTAGDYRAIVSNALGSMTSAVATLTLKAAAPRIAIQPTNKQPYIGGAMTLQVTAYGSEPLFYQWRFNGVDIPGATNPRLIISNLVLNQSGYYSVILSNDYGLTASAKSKVSVMQVVAWGAGTNYFGQNNYGQSIVPLGMSYVSGLAGGRYHSLALEATGRVVAWGAGTNVTGNGGINSGQSVVPNSLTDVIGIAGGQFHSLALRADGYVFGWGATAGQATVPPYLNDIVAIAAGDFHSVALKRDGHVVAWGSTTPSNQQITNIPISAINLVAIASRASYVLGLKGDGQVIRWGSTTSVPSTLSNVVEVAAAADHALALTSEGTVVRLGPGNTPIPPAWLTNVVQIAAGTGFNMALQADGTLTTWANSPDFTGATQIPPGLKHVTAIACGDFHCLAALGDGSLSICTQPMSRLAAPGEKTFLRVGATGTPPLYYQWRFNNDAMIGATNATLKFESLQTSDAGDYSVVVTHPFGSITSRVASVSVAGVLTPPAASLDQSLGGAGLIWTTAGNALWLGQTNVTFNGGPAAQSGHILDNQLSWLQTGLPGPGLLSFWWKVSSEEFFDYLNFYVDGKLTGAISGEVDWQSVSLSLPPGLHILRWAYEKDASASSGSDSGWLAQLSFVPDVPIIVQQPLGATSSMAAQIVLSASALGTPPLGFQWLKDGTVIPGATASSLLISNATRRNSGLYQMVASNFNGSATSGFAPVLVRVPQKLASPSFLLDGTFSLLSGDADGGPLELGDLANFYGQVSTNLVDWTLLSESLELTNATLLLSDPAATNTRPRFYRILEK